MRLVLQVIVISILISILGFMGKYLLEFMSVDDTFCVCECGRISDAGMFHTGTKLFYPSFIVNANSFTSESANI